MTMEKNVTVRMCVSTCAPVKLGTDGVRAFCSVRLERAIDFDEH